ncbi:MAG: CHAT domain-containing protein, partial [Chitinophagales bacterium]
MFNNFLSLLPHLPTRPLINLQYIPKLKETPIKQLSLDISSTKEMLTKAKLAFVAKEYGKTIVLLQPVMLILKEKEAWESYMDAAYALLKAYHADFLFDEFYQAFEDILNIHTEKCSTFLIWKARLYKEKGKILHLSGKLEEAISCFEVAQQILEKEQLEGDLLNYILLYQVTPYIQISNHTKADQLLERVGQSLKKEKEVENDLQAEFHFQKGRLEQEFSNHKEAISHYQRASELFSPENENKKNSAYCGIAVSFTFINTDNEEEWAHYKQIANQYQNPISKQDKYNLANIYLYISIVYNARGEFTQALQYNENALTLYEEVSNQLLYSRLAALIRLGELLNRNRAYDKQINCYQKALQISQQLYPRENRVNGIIYNHLSYVYQAKGDLDKALEYAEKGLTLTKLLNENHNLDIDYRKVGWILTLKGSYSEGLKYLYQALEVCQQGGGDRDSIKTIYLNIASNLHRQGKLKKALEHYHLALIACLPNYSTNNIYHFPTIEQLPLKYYGETLNTLIEKVRGFCDYSRELGVANPPIATKALESAFNTCRLIMDYQHKLQKELKAEGSKLLILDGLPFICQLSIETTLLLAQHTQNTSTLQEAFAFHEQAKSLLFRYSLQENEAKIKSAIDPKILQNERNLKDQIETYLQKIQIEEAKGEQKNKENLKQWKQKHFNETLKHQALIEELEKDYPEYYQLKYKLQSVSLDKLQASLDEQTIILSYFIGIEKGYIFALSADDYQVISLNLPPNFNQQIQDYLNTIHAQNFQAFTEQSHALYCLLVQPLADFIFDIFDDELKKLVIIPDASLQYLPFETLIVEEVTDLQSTSYHELDYLLNHSQIQYHYSTTLYHQYLQKSKAKRQADSLQSPTTSNKVDFMGFAPIYTSDKEETQSIMRELAADYSQWASRSEAIRGGKLIPLPFSEEEVENIEGLFVKKGFNGKKILYDSATKDNFKTLASNAKYLHIAAHGLTNDQFPKLSGIVFHPEANATDIHDSVLSMGEIYQLQLDADLVVLSSCESGIGQLVAGEGLIALNRSFIYSGTKNVMFSLWKVSDEYSSELMIDFYKSYFENPSYTSALRQAKLKML